jgi:hypothetical protein
VVLHINAEACVEATGTSVRAQRGSFKFDGLSIGPLAAIQGSEYFTFTPDVVPQAAVGDEFVVANFEWFCSLRGNRYLKVDRPTPDDVNAPKTNCEADSFSDDSDSHKYCSRPYEDSEAEWSDELAIRRVRGELNPQTWPPVIDRDAFEVSRTGAPTAESVLTPATPVPDDLTLDDLD